MSRITAKEVDILRHLAEQGGLLRLDDNQASQLTLGAKFEFVCAIDAWQSRGNSTLASEGQRLAAADPHLAAIMVSMMSGTAQAVEPFAAPAFEVQPTPCGPNAPDYHLFCNRFYKSLVENGQFDPTLAKKLAGALGEMIDNVIQHSGSRRELPARGIMAYTVTAQTMAYAVADVGQGVLASLRTNPTWSGLATASDALKAAVESGASSRHGIAGTGFKTAIRAIADLSGTLRFRTDNAALTIDGKSAAGRLGLRSSSPRLPGLQVSIDCARIGKY